MESDLNAAYYGVCCSFKEILKNNQRHLLCNMLELLRTTCKATTISGKNVIDDAVQFWLGDILPLMFDSDDSIQTAAVAALEQGIITLSVQNVQSSCYWPTFKNTIVSSYSPRIHKLREDGNLHWHEIWCLFIKILDREILKGASTINSFLSIVELGFRSVDNRVRIEAFLCWRLLINIFATHNELFSPKRLKLICIPLKPSQSKTEEIANVKLRLWWYLITRFGPNLSQHFATIVKPFLVFCFGLYTRKSCSTVNQYKSARAIALPCFASLICENCEFLEQSLKKHELESLPRNTTLLQFETVEGRWQPVVTAVLASIQALDVNDESISNAGQLLHIFLTFLVNCIFRLDLAELSIFVCDELILLEEHVINSTFEIMATMDLKLNRSLVDLRHYESILNATIQMFVSAHTVPRSIRTTCINRFFKLDLFRAKPNQWQAVSTILDVLRKENEIDQIHGLETKLLIWYRVSHSVLEFYREGAQQYGLSEYFIMSRWILWPLHVYISIADRRPSLSFDMSLCAIWKQLLNTIQNSSEKVNTLTEINQALMELTSKRCKDAFFTEFLDAYVASIQKLDFDKSKTLYIDLFRLIDQTLSNTLPTKAVEAYLNTMCNVVVTFKSHELLELFPVVKHTLGLIAQTASKGLIEAGFYEDWKRAILEKLRAHSNKDLATIAKEIFKWKDIFVIIPSVWTLNPDKLTERQKERFAEKSDIPALYNDMSQSQDSSIKPWTPNKIVIAKECETEIVLERSEIQRIKPNNPRKDSPTKKLRSQKQSLEITSDSAVITQSKPAGVKRNSNSSKTELNDKICGNDEVERNMRSTRCSAQRAVQDNGGKESGPESTISRRTRKSLQRNTECSISKEDGAQLDKRNCHSNVNSLDKSKIGTTSKRPDTSVVNDSKTNLPSKIEAEAGLKYSYDQNLQQEYQLAISNVEMREDLATDRKEHHTNKCTVESCHKDGIKEKQYESPTSANELFTAKEGSPKSTLTKFAPLMSPPDRKLTSNNSSPTLRPKPSAHLTGRGAQLINMIRNKKIDISAQCSPATSMTRICGNASSGKQDDTQSTDVEFVLSNNISTPLQSNKLLIFSKRLPSPTASPSASILKRKAMCDSLDDVSGECPSAKRKRVSFHDPPVSLTKEYVKYLDESQSRPKRCLLLERNSSLEAKHVLKRRSKLESMIEIEKYESADISNESTQSPLFQKIHENQIPDAVNPDKGAADVKNKEAELISVVSALDFVIEKYTLEEVFDKYVANGNSITLKSSNILAKFISNCMIANSKIKENILEILSENHSKDFLDHAVQENLSSVVCDRLNISSVIEYVCAKSIISTTCRSNLLSQIPNLLKHIKTESERVTFIKAIMEDNVLSDENILGLIAILINKRSGARTTDPASESAVDSSSNL